jgi:hypothetical protein
MTRLMRVMLRSDDIGLSLNFDRRCFVCDLAVLNACNPTETLVVTIVTLQNDAHISRKTVRIVLEDNINVLLFTLLTFRSSVMTLNCTICLVSPTNSLVTGRASCGKPCSARFWVTKMGNIQPSTMHGET